MLKPGVQKVLTVLKNLFNIDFLDHHNVGTELHLHDKFQLRAYRNFRNSYQRQMPTKFND